MASFQRPNRLFLLAIFCFSTVLAACSSGGGGKGGPSQNSGDTRPDSFTLTAPTGVDLTKVAFNTPVVSAPVTITGIDAATPVSITGGQFSIDNGTFANTASTVRSGQTIRVLVHSPVKAGQSATATLNVGGETSAFTVTTQADTTPPEVAILFPPPASMTEGTTLYLRGTVKDVHGTLKTTGAVLVNGMAATLERNSAGDEATWNVTLPLEMGANEIVVVAEDVAGNTNEDESVNSKRVASIAGESFPDNVNPFVHSINADIGWEDEKPIAYVADDTGKKVFKVDLTSGVRTVLADNEGVTDALGFGGPWGIHLGANGRLYVSDFARGVIFEVDRETGGRTVIAAKNEESFWDSPMGLLFREEQNQQKLYVADNLGKVFWVDPVSAAQTLVVDSSAGLQPGGEIFPSVFGLGLLGQHVVVAGRNGLFTVVSANEQHSLLADENRSRISSIVSAPDNESLYYVNNSEKRVYMFNVRTKQSVPVAGGETNGAENGVENTLVDIWGIDFDTDLAYLLLVDGKSGLIAMDHESKKRVVISKSVAAD